MLFCEHNLLTLIVITKPKTPDLPKFSQHSTPCSTRTSGASKCWCAAIRVNTDYMGDEPVVLLCTNCMMYRQKTNLARCCAIRNKIHCNGILLSPLVTIDHILPVEHHLRANPYLDSTGIVAHAPAVLAACPRHNDINEHVNQPRNIGLTFWHTRHVHHAFVSGRQV